MRFPLGFTSDLRLGFVARGMLARGRRFSFVSVAADRQLDSASLPAPESLEPIVWIGGSEPLEQQEISRYANSLAAAGREVFLHTDGALVRRRIHEFKPSSRFRFVLSFDEVMSSDDAVVLEAIRVAKLSGFSICALTPLRAAGQLGALTKLHAKLHKLDLDGYLILPATSDLELNRAVTNARRLLLNRRWRRLSDMLDGTVFPTVESQSVMPATISPRFTTKSPAAECEEGAQA
jgi:hypothetical protein